METVERRSCLSSANFPYLPVVETPPTQSQQFFRDGRQEEEVGKDGIKIDEERISVARSDAASRVSVVKSTFNNTEIFLMRQPLS